MLIQLLKETHMSESRLDKAFWINLRNQQQFTEFEIHIVTKIINGEGLLDFDEKRMFLLLYQMAFSNKMEKDDFKIKIKKFNQSIPNFLKKLNDILIEADRVATEAYKENVRMLERSRNLPECGSDWDSEEILDFIRNLEDDIYSFSAAERLLGVTRQTLKKYAKEGTYGIKTVQMKKSDYLTKNSIAIFYRKKWEKEHGDWFERMK